MQQGKLIYFFTFIFETCIGTAHEFNAIEEVDFGHTGLQHGETIQTHTVVFTSGGRRMIPVHVASTLGTVLVIE